MNEKTKCTIFTLYYRFLLMLKCNKFKSSKHNSANSYIFTCKWRKVNLKSQDPNPCYMILVCSLVYSVVCHLNQSDFNIRPSNAP